MTVSDPEFRPLNYYVSFSAGYATQLIFYGHFVLLGLELLSVAVDVALMLVNRRKLKKYEAYLVEWGRPETRNHHGTLFVPPPFGNQANTPPKIRLMRPPNSNQEGACAAIHL